MNTSKHDLENNTKKKLLIVGGFPNKDSKIYGGIVTSCRALIQSSFAKTFTLKLLDSTQISNPAPGLIVRLMLAARRYILFIFHLLTFRPNAVLLFTSKGASLAEKGVMAWTSRIFGIPSLVFPRGGALIGIYKKSKLKKIWINTALRGARIFLCQGPTWQKFAIEDVGFPKERTKLVLNWTATPELLQAGRERSTRNLGVDRRFLFVGWLEKEKGIFELLQASASLAKNRNFSITIAGRGRAEFSARDFVTRYKLEQIVSFAGWVEGDALIDLYRANDVFVLPSWAEGFPNAMIEAMACKLAVITTEVGNIPDIVKDRHDALLIPSQSVPALQEAMTILMDDPSLLEAIAQSGHKLASEKFSVESALPPLIESIYQCMK